MERTLKWHLYAIVCFSLALRSIESAAVAKEQYIMDVRSDCIAAGFLDVPRDQTTYVSARSSGGLNQQLTCYLQFNPQTDGDTLKMWLESGAYIGDCDVSLEMTMSDNKYIFGCQSPTTSIPTYQVVNGKASLKLVRKSFGDTDYNFRVGITASRSLAPATDGDSSSGNVGMIVGIVIGIIVAIVIAIIICVCCYRKRHNNASNDRGLLNKDPMTASSTCTFENTAASEKKLLGSDGLEYEVESKLKPKSALERFGPAPSKIQNDNSINRKETEENEKAVNVSRINSQALNNRVNQGNSNKVNQPNLNKVNQPNLNRANPSISNKDKIEIPERTPNIPKPPPISDMLSRQSSSVASSSSETLGGQTNSTLFAALRNNPKFRKSFRENEDDAEDRARRVSSYTSTSSMASDASKPQQPLIKPTIEPKKPQIPPVPKPRPRPASPERLGEVAGIHRPRPSSSTSESSKFDDPNSKANKVKSKEAPKHEEKKKPHRDAQSSDSESSQSNRGGGAKHRHKSTDRDKETKRHHRDDRHSKKNYRSSDSEGSEDRDRKSKHRNRSEDKNRDTKRRQHDDKPSRRHRSKDDYSSESEASDLYGERSKSKRNRERDDKVKDVKRKQDPEELSERGNQEKREKERDYERKFIKSTGVRKSKGKGTHRMNRSKSTGSALEELESNYSASKSAGSVKSLNLNFVDEDIDLDSNLQPFKRAGSKTSLYASRTSLYGRRRKNSMGETMSLSSYMYDDVESRMSDFDRASISQKDKARMFKSTGDLEMKLQNSVIVRDCSTWTGSTKGVDVFDKKTFTRRKPDKRYNRGTQTSSHRERKNSMASEASAHSTHRLKSRSKSQESLSSNRKNKTGKRDRNKSPHQSKSDLRSRSRSRGKSTDSDSTTYTIDTSDSGTTFQSSGKPKLKPKPKARKTEDDDDSELQQHDYETVAPLPTGYMPFQPPVHPQFMPMNYQVPGYPQMPPPNAVPVVAFQKPSIPPKPNQAPVNNSSKWDQLVNLTEGMKKRRHQMGESINETESVLSSAWSEFTPYGGKAQVFYAPANDPNRTYSTSYPESSGQYPQHGYYNGPPESDI